MKTKLLGKTPEELKEIVQACGLPAYTARQIARWMYVRKAGSTDMMTDISLAGRERLSAGYEVGLVGYGDVHTSSDGTRKYLFPVECSHRKGLDAMTEEDEAALEKSAVEAVMIPDGDRATLCVSSQAGCRMGCRFCMTGRQGFHGHLSVADILSQFISVEESGRLTNAVFMGMGEPLDNYDNVMRAIEVLTSEWGFGWSPKRITLSTIGVMPALERYLTESKCHLAVSLHNPFPDERLSIMPGQKAFPEHEVVRLIKKFDFSGQRRVSFEYTMFSGFNDSPRHADALARMLSGLECRVNLIRFHKIPDFPYDTSPDPVMKRFQARLMEKGIVTTIRASRGEDILAACGMLAGQHGKTSE